MIKSLVPSHIKLMLDTRDDKSDRASIVVKGLFGGSFAFIGLFMLQPLSLPDAANGYWIPAAVGNIAIAAALGLSILFRIRRLHVAALLAKREAEVCIADEADTEAQKS